MISELGARSAFPAQTGVDKQVRILVVEDYEPFRAHICRTLRQQPCLDVVGEADDGLAAVFKAQMLQPDLILLDIGLPKLNGIEAARRILSANSAARIIFVTHESSLDIVRHAIRLGVAAYVRKLYIREDLLMAINTVLRGQHFVSSGLATRSI